MEENLYVFGIEQDIFEIYYPWELHIAASKDDLLAVQEAYSKGFSTNTFFEGCCKLPGNKSLLQHTPIHCAAYKGNTSIMKYFISKGENINQPSITEATPLNFSLYTENSKLEMVKLLIENGANTKASDTWNNKLQPLHSSAVFGISNTILNLQLPLITTMLKLQKFF